MYTFAHSHKTGTVLYSKNIPILQQSMIRRLLTFILLFLACLWQTLSAQTTLRLGYCPDEISDQASYLTLNPGSEVRFRAAIVLPASRMQSLKGAKLTKIRVGAPAGMTGWYVTLRNALTSSALIKTIDLPTTVEGWNEAVLPEPFEITGEDLVVYYAGKLPAGKGLLIDGQGNPNGCYIHDGVDWINAYDYGYQSLSLQAEVEVEGELPASDLAIESCSFQPQFCHIGDEVSVKFRVSNYGFSETALPALTYSLNGGEPHTLQPEGSLPASGFADLEVQLPTDDCTDGYNLITASIDLTDGNLDNNRIEAQLPCYATAYPRKSLIEHFTTLPCVNCPYGLNVLRGLVSGRTDYVWVAHHVGYMTDELTVNDSYKVSSIVGVNGAPMACFDRTVLPGLSSNTAAAFSIGYTNPAYGKEELTPYFDQCATTPAFVSVNLDCSFDTATRQLSVNVQGERGALLDLFYPEQNLSVWIVEDQVETTEKQKGSGDQEHDNVFRATLTPMLGDAIEWQDNAYSRSFSYTLPEAWKPEHVRVVALVNRPDEGDGTAEQVLNVNQFALVDCLAAINDATASPANERREYFDLQGRKLAAPASGTYIERISSPAGVSSHVRVSRQ